MKDKNGKKYKVIKIGKQYWMAENLNYPTETGSWCYDDNPQNCEKYGRLYTWETACKVCPDGWHLPTIEEWQQMIDYLKSKNIEKKNNNNEMNLINSLVIESNKMKTYKEENTIKDPFSPDNRSGFSAVFGGYRYYDGKYYNRDNAGFWWTSSQPPYIDVWYKYLFYISKSSIDKDYVGMWFGASVRCVKDSI